MLWWLRLLRGAGGHYQDNLPSSNDCKTTGVSCSNKVVVSVGSSGGNSKTVTASTSVTCPSTVSSANWLGGYTWPDTFAMTTSGSQVSVRRTDSTSGWGMDLRFECCPAGGGASSTIRCGSDWTNANSRDASETYP
eukprot:g58619.t1